MRKEQFGLLKGLLVNVATSKALYCTTTSVHNVTLYWIGHVLQYIMRLWSDIAGDCNLTGAWTHTLMRWLFQFHSIRKQAYFYFLCYQQHWFSLHLKNLQLLSFVVVVLSHYNKAVLHVSVVVLKDKAAFGYG